MTARDVDQYFAPIRQALDAVAVTITAVPLSPQDRYALAIRVAAHGLGTAIAALREATDLCGTDGCLARSVTDVLVARIEARGVEVRQ
jgi:hypothetical protein